MKTPQLKSRAKLPVEVRRALELIVSNVMAFDRLAFRIDHPAPDIPIARIDPLCAKIKVLDCRSLPFHPTWQTEIRIFQPSPDALLELEKSIGTRHRVRLNYVELALDWLVDDRDAADLLRSFTLKHMRVPHMRAPVIFEERTAYFARRSSPDRAKNARNVVLYADRASELWPARHLFSPCCHLEHRLQGVDTLARHGLLSLSDCIQFDHLAYWAEHLRLFSLPSKVELGRWLDPENIDVSGTALAKRSDRLLAAYYHADTFVLQNCCRDNPTIDSVLRPVANTPFIGNGDVTPLQCDKEPWGH